MADRKISELPLFPHHQDIQNSDIYYVVASGIASENSDAKNYRVSFTGLSNDILSDFGGGSNVIETDAFKIMFGAIAPIDDRFVEIYGDTYILDDLYTEGDLHVDGNAFFDQNVSISGDINASGDADFQDLYVHGNAFVKHDTTLTGSLTAYGNVSITGDINASGDADLQDLYVHGNAFFKHDTTISGDLTVLGNTTTIDTERLVTEDSNIEIGDHKELTTEDTANFGGITLKTHNNDSFASAVIEGVTITSRVAGTFGNNITVSHLTFPGLIDEDGVILTDPNTLHGNSLWQKTEITVMFSVTADISEKTQGDLADLLNCYAGHLVRATASDRNAPLGNFLKTSLQNGQGQDGFNKNIEWIKPCDAWTMNTNLNVYGSGIFSEGINAANDTIAGGVKIATDLDTTNYGGLVMEDGYLKIQDWSIGGEAALWVSDINLKDDRKKIDSATEILNQINGIYFTWNESAHASLTGKKDIGIIAQEVQAVLPEIVAENTVGNLAVSYHKMIPVLIESIKELSDQNKSLQSRIEKLESQ